MDVIPLQKIAIAIGDEGCYFSCIVKAAEILRCKPIDLLRTFNEISRKKTSKGEFWVESDCYMNHPELVLGYLIKKSVAVRKEFDLSYKPQPDEIIIGMWEWFDKVAQKKRTHFTNLDDYLKVLYDPMGESNTVKFGKLVSLRVFKIA